MALLFGCMCSLSCFSLLGEGLGHLRYFVPLAVLNLRVGALTSERIARVFLAIEFCLIFGLVAHTVFTYREH